MLGEVAFVLEADLDFWGKALEYCAEVEIWRVYYHLVACYFESYCEFYWQNLIFNFDFERDLVNIFGNHVVIELNLQLLACDKFDPYVDFWLFLNITDDRTELEIFFKCLRLRHLETHWHVSCIEDNQFLTIYVI